MGRLVDLQNAYTIITELYAPKVSENQLNVLIRPTLPAFWNPEESLSTANELYSDRLMSLATNIFSFIAVYIFPFAVEAQAFYHLFDKYGFHNIALWVNAAITTALLASCAIYNVIGSHEPV